MKMALHLESPLISVTCHWFNIIKEVHLGRMSALFMFNPTFGLYLGNNVMWMSRSFNHSTQFNTRSDYCRHRFQFCGHPIRAPILAEFPAITLLDFFFQISRENKCLQISILLIILNSIENTSFYFLSLSYGHLVHHRRIPK